MCNKYTNKLNRGIEHLKNGVDFRKPESSDFLVDWYATVFWYADYEYDYENCRQSHLQGQILNYIFHIFFTLKSTLTSPLLDYFLCETTFTPSKLPRNARLSMQNDFYPISS